MHIVVGGMQANVLSADDVNSPAAQSRGHRQRNVLIHVKLDPIIHRSSL
jgi:hypothetical protein